MDLRMIQNPCLIGSLLTKETIAIYKSNHIEIIPRKSSNGIQQSVIDWIYTEIKTSAPIGALI